MPYQGCHRVGVLGIFLGTIMFWEGILKVLAWFKI
jgi:hypothetical protein